MKYQRKRYETKYKNIKAEYGQCKVLYVDIYNTLLHKSLWLKVKCSKCGKITSKSLGRMKDTIKHGYPNTCGCYKVKCGGDSIQGKRHRLYSIWSNIVGRAECKKSPQYKYYGERGITICKEWRNSYLEFKKWAVNNGYTDTITIDRIDVNGNYEPSICSWVDMKTQTRNKRDNK